MIVRDIMTHQVEGIPAGDTIQHAAVRMRDLDVGALPVFEGDQAVGILTDRDITTRVVAQSLNPLHTSVGEVMSKGPKSCSEETDLEEAARMMENYKIRRILVTDELGQVSGIVSLGDIATHLSREFSGEVLAEVSQPAHPHR